jgi:uncharacterized membrane protein YccF (DUF307 family)
MRTLGNILWHIPFLGFVTATFTYLIGLILTLLVITAPIGLGLMEYGKFLYFPFGHAMVSKKELNIEQNKYWKAYSTIVMVVYFPFGLIYAVMAAIQAAVLALSIIGIPIALIIAKSLGTYLNPVNKKCVHIAVQDELERRKAQAIVSRELGEPGPAPARKEPERATVKAEPEVKAPGEEKFLHAAEQRAEATPSRPASLSERLQEISSGKAEVPGTVPPAPKEPETAQPQGRTQEEEKILPAPWGAETGSPWPKVSPQLLKVLAAVGILASAIFGAWLWELVRQRDEATRDVLQQQQHALNKAEQARRAAEAEARQLREAANEARRQREAASEAERRMQERQPEAERSSTAAPQPEPEGEDRPALVEFKIVNNTSSTVNVAFFDRDNHVHLDPPEERFYIQGGNSTRNYQISCGPSQVICYGAHMQGSGLRPFWGTGQSGTEPCVGCCLTCPASSPLLKTLNDSDSRRPNPTITWKITDNTAKPLSVALYAPARRWGWPGWNQNWTMRSGENTYTVPCNEGERICYGAWVVNNVNGLYWGAGPFGQHACTNCCGICDGGTYTASLSD